ncbi:SPASM domain-containing protein [Dechloromonas sp. A34]|uniref:SPASM domain-containing protein n=1 Tax=Dechloromonas sp. A34 TaxID=447588 RepID=UPI0022490438|nr:SPASM domain-containing protein [Dechloromonas sp. A34]
MKSALLYTRERSIQPEPTGALGADGPQSHAHIDTPLPLINLDLDQVEPGAGRHKGPPAAVLFPAHETKAAIESMPHLESRVVGLWRTRDLNTFIFDLLLDSRDGTRKGFPAAVAKELLLLAKINLQLRAEDAAPLLGVSIEDAADLIAKGDQVALGHAMATHDVWGVNVSPVDKFGHPTRTAANPNPRVPEAHLNPVSDILRNRMRPKSSPAHGGLALLLNESPPTPPSVRLDLTAPKALRSSRGTHHQGGVMDQGFFRCIVKELSGLKIGQLVLSDLGDSEKCNWLPSAIRFAKVGCSFRQVVLQVDLLTAPEQQLIDCINSGLNHLVINLNLASGKWRAKAEAVAESDPNYFRREIQRLVRNRDELAARTGHHCAISIIQPHRKSSHYLKEEFRNLSGEPGLTDFQEVTLPDAIAENQAEFHGACHCWAPFIEAHIRTNGHMVACAQDHSGYSFTADLKHTTFSEAWHSEAFRMTRQRVLHGEKPGRLCDVCPHKANKN